MKEIVNIHIGQAGVQLGNSFWELFCLEHGIQPDGVMPEKHQDDKSFKSFFFENKEGKFTPRCLYIDLEPTVIDEVRTGIYRNLYQSEYLINEKEDAANNFARGYYTIGRNILDLALAKIRNIIEKCDNTQGFIFTHSLSGGTGSGFGSLLSEKLHAEYASKSFHNYCVIPSPLLTHDGLPSAAYNAVMALSKLIEQNVLYFFDNQSMYDICKRDLEIESPRYRTINRMIAQVVSNVTSGWRFDGALNCNMKEIETNLICYPRLSTLIMSYAPFRSIERAYHDYMSVNNMTNKLFDESSILAKTDIRHGKVLAGCLLYRGDVSPKEVYSSVRGLKENKNILFADVSPHSFKVGMNYHSPVSVPGGDIAKTNRSCTFLGNSTCVAEVYDRICHKFDLPWAKRAFVHWFVGEGMEEGNLVEARENLASLCKDYEEVGLDTIEEGNEGDGTDKPPVEESKSLEKKDTTADKPAKKSINGIAVKPASLLKNK